ncbi:MAG: hypothetical protein ACK4PK_06160 [Alphaproteobacteria bacterium]
MTRETAAADTSEWLQRLQRRAGALTLAFGMTVAAAQDAQATATASPAPAGEATPALGPVDTLWKTNVVDAVLRLRTCPETGICGSLHWVNPEDRRAFDYFGDQDSKKTFRPTRQDIMGLCDYAPRMQFNQVAPNRWEGKLDMRGRGVTVNMTATLVGDNQIQVVASKAIFSERDTWTRVAHDDPRYPRCTPVHP